MNKTITIILGVLVLLGIIYFAMGDKDDAMEKQAVEEKAMMEQKAQEEKDVMVKEDNSMMEGGEVITKGTYEVYSQDKVALAGDNHDVVLFFRASWCPTCRALDASINANLGTIPATLTILDVDYDNSSELKKKYGVTSQHTLVQVDKDGNLIKKWSGGNTLVSIIAEVK